MEEVYKGYYILYSPSVITLSVKHEGIWVSIYSPHCGGKWLNKYIVSSYWSKDIKNATSRAHTWIDHKRKDISSREYEKRIAKFLK